MNERPWVHRSILIGFGLVYGWFFVAWCLLDDSPWQWDEAFFLYHPTAVVRDLRADGLLAGLRTFMGHGYHKPPLSSFGTLPAMLLFGNGSLAVRVDNLVLALATLWLLFLHLRKYMAKELAAAAAVAMVSAPYALYFPRTELAEPYLWAATILYLFALDRVERFTDRRMTLLLGLALGLALLAKTSFPVVAAGPSLWVLVSAFVREPAGSRRRQLTNLVLAGALAVLVAAPFYIKNWPHIRHHMLGQFGWMAAEYDMGNRWSQAYLSLFFREWGLYFGGYWKLLAALAVLSVLVLAARRRLPDLLRGLPAGPLVVGIVINCAYFYFHPVVDMRFSYGGFLMLQLLVAMVLGKAVTKSALPRAWVAGAACVPALLFLLAHSYLPLSGARVLEPSLPVVGPAPHLLDLERPRCADLTGEVLARCPPNEQGQYWITLAGDHPRLNNNNIELLMIERGVPGGLMQLGYMETRLPMRDRFLYEQSRRAKLWAVLDKGPGAPPGSWTDRTWKEALQWLRANPATFRELPWVGELGDGHRVRLFLRTAPVDESLIAPESAAAHPFRMVAGPRPRGAPAFVLRWGQDDEAWRSDDGSGAAPVGLEVHVRDGRREFVRQELALEVPGGGGSRRFTRPISELPRDCLYRIELATMSLEPARHPAPWSLVFGVGNALFHSESRGGRRVHDAVFHTGSEPPAELVVGSERLAGRARIGEVRLDPLVPSYRDYGTCVLGDGESVRGGQYGYAARFADLGPGSRCLATHRATFADSKWLLAGAGDHVSFRHELGTFTASAARVSLSLASGDRSDLVVEATSGDTRMELRPVPTGGSGPGERLSFDYPAALLPAQVLHVTLSSRSGAKAPVRVSDYSVEARVDAPDPLVLQGQTLFDR